MTALNINMTAGDLKAAILAKFPANATCWSQATDEVRDMSRWAREILRLPALAAVNFSDIRTPDRWNTAGAESAAEFWAQMNASQRLNYLTRIEGFLA